MKNFFTFLFVLFLHSAWATNYYFSAVSGDDSRTSAQAQNPSTPWKSLNKLNSFFKKLHHGDAVLLKCGETFYGSIIVNKSGTAGAPIVVGAYGSGSRPVITGLTTLTNWVAVGNGIYESYNPSLGSNLNIVLLNNAPQPIGRYPNTGYLTLESHSGNTITDNELSSSPNWTGAELVLRTNHWKLDRYKITSQLGNTIHYSGNYAQNKFGYFIQNSIKTLDKLGEWSYNPATKKVSMYFGAHSPASYHVTASSVDNLIYSARNKYVVIENLTLKGANSYGVNISSGSNFTIQNSDVSFSGIDGVKVLGHAYFTIENCDVLNSYNNGIDAGVASPYAIVRNNTVKNSYYVAGMGQSGDVQGASIRINKNGLAEYNRVINSGYVGIRFDGDYSVVKNNYIDTFCFVKDDGGAIYAYNGRADITNTGRKITGNIILNGIGAADGTDSKNTPAEGIYLDDNTNGVELTGNTISNCNRGIYLHNSRQIVVKNNTSFNNDNGQLYMKHDELGDNLRNHTITNNIFFSKISRQFVSSINSTENDIEKTGRLDSNYYARPINNGSTIYSSIINKSGITAEKTYDLNAWKSQYKFDNASKTSGKQITPFKIKNLIGSNKYASGSFNTRKHAGGWANDCVISWENAGVLDGGYLKITPSAKSSSIVLGVGAISSNKKYILKYSVKGSSPMSISAYLRSANYKPVSNIEYRTVNVARNENEIVFSSSSDQTNSSLVLTADAQSKYYLDNIQLFEAEASVTNPDDSIRFVYNPTNVNKTVNLDGSYVDVKSNKYSNSITLQPYTSAVLIKDGLAQNTNRNAAPSVSITSPEVNKSYNAAATIKIKANATDADGEVTKVEFYNGTTLLHTQLKAPYSWDWKNVPAGNYTITAKATDNSKNVTTSESVTVSVAANNASPKVNITNPEVNASYKAEATIGISADASDADGKITKVEFYNGTTLLHTEHYVPYTYSWKNVAAGNYTITAKATDNDGNVTTSESVTVSVKASSAAPKVNITSPEVNANYKSGATIHMSANATDADGKIKKVEFYNGNILLHTENYVPYTYSWHNVPAGNYTITAKATDNDGNVTTSESVTISVVSKHASNRAANNNVTSVAVNNDTDVTNNDTPKIVNNVHAVTLKRSPVSIAEPKTYNVKVFPNPAVNKIQISVEGLQMNNQKANLSITNLSGIMIKSIPVILAGKTLEADVTSLTPGMYIVSIVSDNLIISKKFIKN